MNKKIALIIMLIFAILTVLTGCKNSNDNAQQAVQKAVPVEMVSMAYFVPNDQATGVVKKEVKIAKSQATPQKAIETLLVSQEKEEYSVFPKGLKVLHVKVDNHIALVEMNKVFLKPVDSGSLTERLEIASLVNTLTEFKDIQGVVFIVDGTPVTSLSGHIDMREPLQRMKDLIRSK